MRQKVLGTDRRRTRHVGKIGWQLRPIRELHRALAFAHRHQPQFHQAALGFSNRFRQRARFVDQDLYRQVVMPEGIAASGLRHRGRHRFRRFVKTLGLGSLSRDALLARQHLQRSLPLGECERLADDGLCRKSLSSASSMPGAVAAQYSLMASMALQRDPAFHYAVRACRDRKTVEGSPGTGRDSFAEGACTGWLPCKQRRQEFEGLGARTGGAWHQAQAPWLIAPEGCDQLFGRLVERT